MAFSAKNLSRRKARPVEQKLQVDSSQTVVQAGEWAPARAVDVSGNLAICDFIVADILSLLKVAEFDLRRVQRSTDLQ
jgi:hypothetical protein